MVHRSAGWMYRIGLESILGFQLRGDRLHVNPCIPSNWPGFEITYRYKATLYIVTVENKGKAKGDIKYLELDSIAVDREQGILLVNDEKQHQIVLVLG